MIVWKYEGARLVKDTDFSYDKFEYIATHSSTTASLPYTIFRLYNDPSGDSVYMLGIDGGDVLGLFTTLREAILAANKYENNMKKDIDK